MSSAALIALQTAIRQNTLSPAQQAALDTALGLIIPNFPTPDELSNSIPVPEEVLARDWIAALYTIQAESAGIDMLARVITPNAEAGKVLTPLAPGVATVLLVADITPTTTGLLMVSVNVAVIEDAPGVPGLALFYVPNLTAVTGGTPIAPGLTDQPTSTTPAFGAGTLVWTTEQDSFNDGVNPNNAIPVMAGVPIQAVVGQRSGIIVVARDTAAQNWTSVAASVSVIEV
jgi:hypothetical protein